MDPVNIKQSELSVTKFTNKKNELKFNINLNEKYLLLLLENDTNVLNFIKKEFEKLKL